MKFTDRFISLPIKEFNKNDLLGKTEYRATKWKILPFEISDYRETIDEDNNDEQCVSLYLKNGSNAYVYMNIDEFENLLNAHQERI